MCCSLCRKEKEKANGAAVDYGAAFISDTVGSSLEKDNVNKHLGSEMQQSSYQDTLENFNLAILNGSVGAQANKRQQISQVVCSCLHNGHTGNSLG